MFSIASMASQRLDTSLAPPVHALHQTSDVILWNHIKLLLQGLDQHLSCFWLSPSRRNSSTKLVAKMFSRAKVRRVRHPLLDINSLILQKVCCKSGCMRSCIILLKQEDIGVRFREWEMVRL